MLEDVVNSLITRFLGDYIKDIDKNDLRVSLWKGDLKFKNLVYCSIDNSLVRR